MDLQVFILTWNTQTIRYNLDNGPEADFVSILSDKIIKSHSDLIIIGLQEDAIRDSPLLSEQNSLIVDSISEKYQLIKLVTLSGWGITTFKALKHEWDYRPRGLRLAVLKRRDLKLEIINVEVNDMVCPSLKNWITAGKGGVVINLHTSIGKLTFLNIHLPFSSRSIIQDPEDKISYRHSAMMWQARCLRKLYENVIKAYQPNYLFILGDLNFRVQIRTESGAAEIVQRLFTEPGYIKELIQEADELQLLFDYSKFVGTDSESSQSSSDEEIDEPLVECQRAPIPLLNEGIDNSGPQFLPTCKLQHGRKECNLKSYKLGQQNQRTPSWCDRILFKQFPNANGELCCVLYDRWEHGAMNLSDHAAVLGVYRITVPTSN